MRSLLIFFVILVAIFAQRTRIAVLSDTHIGSSWTQNPPRLQLIRDTLSTFANPNTNVHTVVIAGDLLENWLYTFDQTPITYSDILRSTNLFNANITSFIEVLKAIRNNGVELVYMPGNHDDLLTNADFSAVGLNLTFVTEAYTFGNVRIEHGHFYDLFNAPDPANVRPFGYYVSRGVVTSGRSSSVSTLSASLCDVFLGNRATVAALMQDALDLLLPMMDNALGGGTASLLLTEYRKYQDTVVKGGCYYPSSAVDNKLGILMNKYKSLVSRFVNAKGDGIVERMIDAACFDFDYFIQRLNADLVILGHTHRALLKTYNKGGVQQVYINSGGFVDSLAIPTMVYIDTSYGRATYASLMEYVDGEWRLRRGETIGGIARVPPTPPATWTCSSTLYGTGDSCNCNCGAYDPDCDRSDLQIENCKRVQHTKLSCSSEGFCRYDAIRPSSWTCPSSSFFVPNTCNCGCGAYDPSCAFNYNSLNNCPANSAGCSIDGKCIANGTLVVPAGWTCPPDFYGRNDGCDCNCGVADPDCAGSTTCACDGTAKVSSAINLIPSVYFLLIVLVAVLCI